MLLKRFIISWIMMSYTYSKSATVPLLDVDVDVMQSTDKVVLSQLQSTIRMKCDPKSRWIKDSDIVECTKRESNHPIRSTLRALLIMLIRAKAAQDSRAIVDARAMYYAIEHKLIKVE